MCVGLAAGDTVHGRGRAGSASTGDAVQETQQGNSARRTLSTAAVWDRVACWLLNTCQIVVSSVDSKATAVLHAMRSPLHFSLCHLLV